MRARPVPTLELLNLVSCAGPWARGAAIHRLPSELADRLPRSCGRVTEYNATGFTFPVDVFTPAEAAANKAYFDWVFAEAETRGINNYKVAADVINLSHFHTPLVTRPPAFLYGESLIMKATEELHGSVRVTAAPSTAMQGRELVPAMQGHVGALHTPVGAGRRRRPARPAF